MDTRINSIPDTGEIAHDNIDLQTGIDSLSDFALVGTQICNNYATEAGIHSRKNQQQECCPSQQASDNGTQVTESHAAVLLAWGRVSSNEYNIKLLLRIGNFNLKSNIDIH